MSLFRAIPPDLSQHHAICETFDLLGVDVLGGQKIDDITSDLKLGKTDYEIEYKYYIPLKGNRSKARDAAFKLLYLMLFGEFEDEQKDSMKMFNAVLFVVSHHATFKKKTRAVVRAAYEDRFVVSAKQLARLDEWVNEGAANQEDTVDDVTTENDSSDVYDSDEWD